MAIDGSGNWYPQLPDNPTPEDFSTGGAGSAGDASTAHLKGTGSPVGAVTPLYVGQQYLDITNAPAGPCPLWQATGLTSADWQQIT